MTLYASGQQPNQRTSNGANVLTATFTITAATEHDNKSRQQHVGKPDNMDDVLRFEPYQDVNKNSGKN